MDITLGTAVPQTNGYSYGKKAAADKGVSADGKAAKNTDRAEFSSSVMKNPAAHEDSILPEKYKKSSLEGKMYYQGKLVTQYELIETAVKTGAVSLEELEKPGLNTRCVMDALVYSKASPAYPWSSTLYTEDRKYVLRVENGQVTGMTKAYFDDGTDFFDVAKEIASGKMLCDIDPCELDWFRSNDKELFDAACRIGSAKRHYDQTEECYRNGHITKSQYLHDMYPLVLLLFGAKGDIYNNAHLNAVRELFTGRNFASEALSGIGKENRSLFDALISQKGYHTYSGLY